MKKTFEEKGFDLDFFNDNPEMIHQLFWEMSVGIVLSQEFSNVDKIIESSLKCTPDYSFKYKTRTVYVEATATKESPKNKENEQNRNYSYDFEDGLDHEEDENERVLKLTSAIKTKSEKNYCDIGNDDLFVLAINGHEALGSSSLTDGLSPMCIVKALFGVGGSFIDKNGEERYKFTPARVKHNGAKIETNYFLPNNKTSINGILYSNSNMYNIFSKTNWESALKDDWVYIQNPAKEDLTNIFSFCRMYGG